MNGKSKSKDDLFGRDSSPDESSQMSFADATAALQKEEEERRMADRGTGLTQEDVDKYNEKMSDIEEMRKKIRERAAEIGVEKSGMTSDALMGQAENAATEKGISR